MSHEQGAYLGGVRDIEGIRMRCVCEPGSNGCWSFRSARGKPMPKGKRHVVWVYGRGPISLPRVVWEFRAKRSMPDGWCAYRICDSYDCANPEHIKAGPFEFYVKAAVRRGVFKSNAANARKVGYARSKLTPELRIWAIESSQSDKAAAHGLGVGRTVVNGTRKRHRARMQEAAPSVFHLGAML